MQIIVNVDDSGLHPAVRRAVSSLSSQGIVTSTTLMANGPDLEHAAKVPDVGLGVHLNLLRGTPLSKPGEIPTLVGEDGLLLGKYGKLFCKHLRKKLNLAEVQLEWDRQISKIRDLGVNVTHLDSEKHIHAWPAMMNIACNLAKKHGIGAVRRPVEKSDWGRLDKGGLRVKFLSACGMLHMPQPGVFRPSGIWGVADQKERLSPELFFEYMQRFGPKKRNDVVEICCHPGLEQAGDPDLPKDFGPLRVRDQWKIEYEALQDPDWLEVFSALGARLAHFGNI